MKVLVVDDDLTIRVFLRRVLERTWMARVTEADNGMVALEQLDRDAFDLVLLDLEMPVVDGLSVLKTVRSSTELKDMPVIAVSSHGEREMVLDAIRSGANDFILKPLSLPVVVERINRLGSSDRLSGAGGLRRALGLPGGASPPPGPDPSVGLADEELVTILRDNLLPAAQMTVGVMTSRQLSAAGQTTADPSAVHATIRLELEPLPAVALTLSAAPTVVEALAASVLGEPTPIDAGARDVLGDMAEAITGRIRATLRQKGLDYAQSAVCYDGEPVPAALAAETGPRRLTLDLQTSQGETLQIAASLCDAG